MQPPSSNGDEDRTLVGQITRSLADRIVSGAIAPGARLRQEHIAAEFKASHVPVREAFRRLEAQGLVQSEPRRGVRVSPLEAADVLELTEMRASLECVALRNAAGQLGQPDIEKAAEAIAAGEMSADLAVWDDANRRFHMAILGPCRMPRLLATIEDLHRAGARFLYATWRDLDWQPRSDREHHAILDALAAAETLKACEMLERHIKEAGQALVGRLRNHPD
jgi:DNA-binding GntR family transcriptional regulator